MMIAYFVYLILSPALFFVKSKVEMFSISDILKELLKGLYYIFPKTSELMSEILLDISTGKSIINYQLLIFVLGFGVFLFARKDF